MENSNKDPWLDRWLPLVKERARHGLVLELGCGSGRDTATLVDAGLSVVGIDLSPSEIEVARGAVPKATFFVQDLRAPFPIAPDHVDVIVASLSLHYFSWAETLQVIKRINAILGPTGLLLCRLNSTRDRDYGAVGYPAIEENYYLVEGRPKRFFDVSSIQSLFSKGWRVLSLEEMEIGRYAMPKRVWEIVLERDAQLAV